MSYRSQSYKNTEFIIDGGATDSTMDIVDEHKDIVDYVISARGS
jgi:hypothetical protein